MIFEVLFGWMLVTNWLIGPREIGNVVAIFQLQHQIQSSQTFARNLVGKKDRRR